MFYRINVFLDFNISNFQLPKPISSNQNAAHSTKWFTLLDLGPSSSGLVILMALITIPIPIAITKCAITVPLNFCVLKN